MKRLLTVTTLVLLASFTFISFNTINGEKHYKCMIQLKNYTGEGAYVIVSLLDEEGAYNETLYVQGKDSEWYNEITAWWKFYGKTRPDIDAICGATVSGGERTITVLKIPTDKIDSGYNLRFETAVEDQEYYEADLEFPLTQENLKGSKEGSGFIRYVRLMPQ